MSANLFNYASVTVNSKNSFRFEMMRMYLKKSGQKKYSFWYIFFVSLSM